MPINYENPAFGYLNWERKLICCRSRVQPVQQSTEEMNMKPYRLADYFGYGDDDEPKAKISTQIQRSSIELKAPNKVNNYLSVREKPVVPKQKQMEPENILGTIGTIGGAI